jgi:hypothetical protein
VDLERLVYLVDDAPQGLLVSVQKDLFVVVKVRILIRGRSLGERAP